MLDLAVRGRSLAVAAFGAALAPTLFWALSSFQGCASSVGPLSSPCVTGCPECDGRGPVDLYRMYRCECPLTYFLSFAEGTQVGEMQYIYRAVDEALH